MDGLFKPEIKDIIGLLGWLPLTALAFAPRKLQEIYLQGRLNLQELKLHEKLLDEVVAGIAARMKERWLHAMGDQQLDDPAHLALEFEEYHRQLRYLNLVKRALVYLPEPDSIDTERPKLSGLCSDQKSSPEGGSKGSREHESGDEAPLDPHWFDLFCEQARRINEPWRADLLARALALTETEHRTISLKTLWSFPVLEKDHFDALALFLDSCVDIDGYPAFLLDSDAQLVPLFTHDGKREAYMAHLIGLLKEHGLVSTDEFDVPSDETIVTRSIFGEYMIDHRVEAEGKVLRFSGYHCTDFALDLRHLYTPKFNEISGQNHKRLLELLSKQAAIGITPLYEPEL